MYTRPEPQCDSVLGPKEFINPPGGKEPAFFTPGIHFPVIDPQSDHEGARGHQRHHFMHIYRQLVLPADEET